MQRRGRVLCATFLPGLATVVREELRSLPQRPEGLASGRESRRSEFVFSYAGRLRDVLELRTVLAVYSVQRFAVPRPKALLSSEHLPAIVESILEVGRLNRDNPPDSFQIDAAGAESPVFARIAAEIEAATGLTWNQPEANCRLRIRPSESRTGWEVLTRLTTRPLGLRPWRTGGYAGALNATIAAAMIRLTRPTPADRFLNLMCGSGTLLVERLLMSPVAAAVGVDRNPAAIDNALENLSAAGRLAGPRVHCAELVLGDIRRDDDWAHRSYDVVVSDPPWGDKQGSHRENLELYGALLDRAAAVAEPGARFVVISHELRLLDELLPTRGTWHLERSLQVDAKGLHPRIYLLTRTDLQDRPGLPFSAPSPASLD